MNFLKDTYEEGDPCPRCYPLAGFGHIRWESVMPLRGGSLDALAPDGSGPCCIDCAAADRLHKTMPGMEFHSMRTCTGEDRVQQMRIPGAPLGLIQAGMMEPNKPGDWERHQAWLNERVPEYARGLGLEED